jgi:hypothetical protein
MAGSRVCKQPGGGETPSVEQPASFPEGTASSALCQQGHAPPSPPLHPPHPRSKRPPHPIRLHHLKKRRCHVKKVPRLQNTD